MNTAAIRRLGERYAAASASGLPSPAAEQQMIDRTEH